MANTVINVLFAVDAGVSSGTKAPNNRWENFLTRNGGGRTPSTLKEENSKCHRFYNHWHSGAWTAWRQSEIWELTCNHQSHPHKWLRFDTNVEHNHWHLCGSSDQTNQVCRCKYSYWRCSTNSVRRWRTAAEKKKKKTEPLVRLIGILYGNIFDWAVPILHDKYTRYFTMHLKNIYCAKLPEDELHSSDMAFSWILIYSFILDSLSIPRSIYVPSKNDQWSVSAKPPKTSLLACTCAFCILHAVEVKQRGRGRAGCWEGVYCRHHVISVGRPTQRLSPQWVIFSICHFKKPRCFSKPFHLFYF